MARMARQVCRACQRRRHPVPRIYGPDPETEADLDLDLGNGEHQRQQALAAKKRLHGESFVGRYAIDEYEVVPTAEELVAIEREG